MFDQARILDAVQESLRAALAGAPWPPALIEAAADVLGDPTRALGGRLTPWVLFPLCCCAAACGEWRPALPAAVAAELYSAALDLCDDIEDGDLSVAVERYGMPIALNLATALLGLAHVALHPSAAIEGLAVDEAASRLAQDALWQGLVVATGGQHVDLAAAGAAALSVEECLDIARRKGGALVEACCRAGAAFGTRDHVLIERFGLMGRSLGLASQIDNDMHDADDIVRKSDLARRKQTIPIALARAHGHMMADAAVDLSQAVWQGGIQMAYALMHAEMARAREALEAAAGACPDPSGARAALEFLLGARGPSPREAQGAPV